MEDLVVVCTFLARMKRKPERSCWVFDFSAVCTVQIRFTVDRVAEAKQLVKMISTTQMRTRHRKAKRIDVRVSILWRV